MRKPKLLQLTLITSLLLPFGCKNSDHIDPPTICPNNTYISGYAEKGPLQEGGKISIQPLDDNMKPIGEVSQIDVTNNLGQFQFDVAKLKHPSGAIQLNAEGLFFNEITGNHSEKPINLKSIIGIDGHASKNINIVTHLVCDRTIKLMESELDLHKAYEQAHNELLQCFGLQKYKDTDMQSVSISNSSEAASALIAITSYFLNQEEEDLNESLAHFCNEFAENGAFSENSNRFFKQERKALSSKLKDIEKNIESHYKSLGTTTNVKDLIMFYDWNDDGIAGNEGLPEGETVTLETNAITVPSKGGSYRIEIESSIPVYTEKQKPDDGTNDPIEPEKFNIYEEGYEPMKAICSVQEGSLIIKIKPSLLKHEQKEKIELYDYFNKVVATLEITQEANDNPPIPNLSVDGASFLNTILEAKSNSFRSHSLSEYYIEQSSQNSTYFHRYLQADSHHILEQYSNYYDAIKKILTLQKMDKDRMGVYQENLDVYSAICYFNMAVLWGDICHPNVGNFNTGNPLPRTSIKQVFETLERKLRQSITVLPEKKYDSFGPDNFFLTKDIAQITLANIYLYQERHEEAKELLSEIIATEHYTLNSIDYSTSEGTSNIPYNDEVILAYRGNQGYLNGRSFAPKAYIPLYTYSDVLLSYAECLEKLNDRGGAREYINKLLTAKKMTPTGNVMVDIARVREKIYGQCVGNFAFFKRIGTAQEHYQIERFRLLLPIPEMEIQRNPNLQQNPGY